MDANASRIKVSSCASTIKVLLQMWHVYSCEPTKGTMENYHPHYICDALLLPPNPLKRYLETSRNNKSHYVHYDHSDLHHKHHVNHDIFQISLKSIVPQSSPKNQPSRIPSFLWPLSLLHLSLCARNPLSSPSAASSSRGPADRDPTSHPPGLAPAADSWAWDWSPRLAWEEPKKGLENMVEKGKMIKIASIGGNIINVTCTY